MKYNYDLTNLYKGLDYLGIDYNDDKIDKLMRFYEYVVSTSKVMNLTTITQFDKFVDKHLIDSLTLKSAYPEINSGISVIDVGTGAGFPGIPLAIMYDKAHFTLLDTLSKRINFIDDVVSSLSLDNVDTLIGRCEDLAKDAKHRESYDLCVTRAVAELNVLSELTIPFVKLGGHLIAYKSIQLEEELPRANKAISVLGGHVARTVKIEIEGIDYNRSLLVIDKSTATPAKYPRKAGIPKKRPL